MTKMFKICMVGTHCSGKSTLVDALSAKMPEYPFIKEVAARFPREERQHLVTQYAIMSAQIEEEMKHTFFISDRSVIDNIAYTTLNFEESIAGQTVLDTVITRCRTFTKCLLLEQEYMKAKPYDLIVFIDEMFPIEDNGNRCLNEKFQKWIFDFLKGEVVVSSETYGIPYLCVTGSTEERVQAIVDTLQKMGS